MFNKFTLYKFNYIQNKKGMLLTNTPYIENQNALYFCPLPAGFEKKNSCSH